MEDLKEDVGGRKRKYSTVEGKRENRRREEKISEKGRENIEKVKREYRRREERIS